MLGFYQSIYTEPELILRRKIFQEGNISKNKMFENISKNRHIYILKKEGWKYFFVVEKMRNILGIIELLDN